MELIKTYNEEHLFRTEFTGSGWAILVLLIFSLIGLGERVLYDLARTFANPIGDMGYFENSKVIIVHAIFVVGLLILTLAVNYVFGRKREKYAIVLIPYFITSIILAIQLAIQLGVYFTTHHNNLQFYLVMSLLVVVTSYGIFHIQNNYKKVRDTSQTNTTGLLAIFVIVFALFAILILSFGSNKFGNNVSQYQNNYNDNSYNYDNSYQLQPSQDYRTYNYDTFSIPSAQTQFTWKDANYNNTPTNSIRTGLKVGDYGDDVALVNNVLMTEQLLPISWDNKNFTSESRKALSDFQMRHGLLNTGTTDQQTLNFLNTKFPNSTTFRIALWMGAINQYWNPQTFSWQVDQDEHDYGADVNQLSYCQRWYPQTKNTKEYKVETIPEYYRAGHERTNTPYTVLTIECVQ